MAGPHQSVTASTVRSAARTFSGGALRVFVLSKSSLVSVRSVAVVMGASFRG